MWSPRAQSDRARFIEAWRHVLENNAESVDVAGQRKRINHRERPRLWRKDRHAGRVSCRSGCTYQRNIPERFDAYRADSNPGRSYFGTGFDRPDGTIGLFGYQSARMKTGTPVRIDARSVHFDEMAEQPGEDDFHKFSYLDTSHRELKQLCCWTCFTNERVHEILREGLPDSPLYNGQIKSIGPRYCPSIETKIVTFADKTQHQLFLEPEGENTHELYLNGFSSSLPLQIQLRALQAIPAFRDVQIYRPGYAIEYDSSTRRS